MRWSARTPTYLLSYIGHRFRGALFGNRPAEHDGLRFVVPKAVPRSFDYLWGFSRGEYEGPERRIGLAGLDPNLPLLEVGSGLGGVSIFLNRALKHPRQHLAVEMNGSVLQANRANRDGNGCQYELVHAALAYGGETVRHDSRGAFMGQGVDSSGDQSVRAVTVEGLAQARGWARLNLVMDVEGMESQMVAHELAFLRRCVARLVLELHPQVNPQEAANVLQVLVRNGFDVLEFEGDAYAFSNNALAASP